MSGLTARTAEKERRGTKSVVHGRDKSVRIPGYGPESESLKVSTVGTAFATRALIDIL